MNLPTEEQCLQYFDEFKVPSNIKNHCLKVRDVALFIAKQLKENGSEINLDLVNSVALLHDLFKVVTINDLPPNKFYNFEFSGDELQMREHLREKYKDMHECDVAYLFFKDKFPELAKSLKYVSNTFNEDKKIEEEVAHYADWRILNNQIILLDNRLTDLKSRYGDGDGFWDSRVKIVLETEKRLFSQLNFNPEELVKRMQNG